MGKSEVMGENTSSHETGRANKVAINTPEIDFLAQIERCHHARGGKGTWRKKDDFRFVRACSRKL